MTLTDEEKISLALRVIDDMLEGVEREKEKVRNKIKFFSSSVCVIFLRFPLVYSKC